MPENPLINPPFGGRPISSVRIGGRSVLLSVGAGLALAH
jgi:hypothetical protein